MLLGDVCYDDSVVSRGEMLGQLREECTLSCSTAADHEGVVDILSESSVGWRFDESARQESVGLRPGCPKNVADWFRRR
jgi:hypothetical protein